MDIRDRIEAGEFDNAVGYPSRCNPRYKDKNLWFAALKSYHAAAVAAQTKFRAALASEYHMTNHPKEERLWNLAWEEGHISGLQDVVYYYEEFLELMDQECHEALKEILPMFESMAVQVYGPDALDKMMKSENADHPYRLAKKAL